MGSGLGGSRILVADPRAGRREALAQVLRNAGCAAVDMAADVADDAGRAADAIVIDAALFERSDRRPWAAADRPPLLILADADELATAGRDLADAADDVLVWPVPDWVLVRRLTMVLEHRAFRQAVREREAALAEMSRSEERYALAASASTDGIFDWDTRTDRVHYSARWCETLGLDPTAVDDAPAVWLDRVHPEDLIWLQATLEAQMGHENRPFQIEYRMEDVEGRERWMLCRGIAVANADGDVVRIVGAQSDVTARKRAEEELRRSEERYALSARGANDGLWDWSISSSAVYYSERWKAIIGLEDTPMVGDLGDWLDRVLPEDRPELEAALTAHVAGHTDHIGHEFRMYHRDGSVLWLLVRGVAVRDATGDALRVAGSMTDITARKRAEIQLSHDAFHDGLTGLPNRALFMDRIHQSLQRFKATPSRQFAVLLFALDRFKTVNDSLGPLVGDRLLVEVGRRLDQARRPSDTVARIGGDEFGVLVEDEPEVAIAEATRLGVVIAEPITLSGHEVSVTASIGVSVMGPGYSSRDELLRDASLAAYRAKSAGRHRVEVFDDALRERAVKMLRLETDLRNALDQQQLKVFFQPIVELSTAAVAGFEALLRWRHPVRGLVSPADFIPLAEETGLIVPVGRWVLLESCRQLAAWNRNRAAGAKPVFMSVNISGVQFKEDDVVRLVDDVLVETGIEPSLLKCEITESLLLDDPARAQAIIRNIRDLRVQVSLDDFGTGYSSLSYLHRFEFDVLKIDQSFVRGASERQNEIVKIIALLARSLGLGVVVEGIESDVELRTVRSLGCQYGQGYLFGRPMPAEDFDPLSLEPMLKVS